MAKDQEEGSISHFKTNKVEELSPGKGIAFEDGVYIKKTFPVTWTVDHTILVTELGKSLRMNSTSDRTFTFPTLGEEYDGALVECIRLGTGKVTVDGGTVNIGSADYTSIYNDETGEYGRITFQWVYVKSIWVLTGQPFGTWIPEA